MSSKTIHAMFLGRWFGKYRKFVIIGDKVELISWSGHSTIIQVSSLIDFPVVKGRFLSSEINLSTLECDKSIYWMRKHECNLHIPELFNNFSKVLDENIDKACKVFVNLTKNQYLRDSSITLLENDVFRLVNNYLTSKVDWSQQLNTDSYQWLNQVKAYFPLKENIDLLRQQYESNELLVRKSFYDKIESNPLTEEQRLSVIRNNDRNLILAAAGTGKTSVMVAKALDFIDSDKNKPEDILILAYNNAAAKELRERMELRSAEAGMDLEKQPTIMTFHALGRMILKTSGVTTYISHFAEDPIKLKMWVSLWLVNYVKSSSQAMINLIDLSYQPMNPFDFKTKAEYEAYIQDNDYRTLKAEKVKGYQELLIANWLFMNGIDYEYEAPYVSKRRIVVGYDYRPDFHFTGTSIYLEHFGIDRQGKTRADIDALDYNQKILSKRELHEECGTILLETYHYDYKEENLLYQLEKLVLGAGLKIKTLSEDEILKTLNETGFIEKNAERYLKCLQAIRVERINKQEILVRLEQNKVPNAKKYSELLQPIVDDYIQELKNQNRIDFDDMIIRALQLVKDGKYSPQWTNILVDEFQDISAARMEFLQTIVDKGQSPCMTVVGDDWQAIYRFSGGKLELTTRFEEIIGSCTTTKLQKTFRYNNSIADIAGDFVMVNPEQYTKHIVTNDQVESPQIFLLDSRIGDKNNLEQRTLQVIKTIRKNDKSASIAVLGRYRYLINNTKEIVINADISNNIKYWTFHGSKGLEADYCVLIGFFQGKTGFPNQNKDEALVEALLPTLDEYPHSEERRLLYVAITRARKKSYIIADPMAPSEFITELLTPKYNLHIGSSTFKEKYRRIFKCPVCDRGYFKGYQGQYGLFYRCTSGIACESKPRVCQKCGSPSVDGRDKSICNNVECGETLKICPKCGRPMKLRNGRFGEFWGCTGYGLKEDRCKQTEKLSTSSKIVGIFNNFSKRL